MDKVISLESWQDGKGWVWEVDDDGTTRRYRTDKDCEGQWLWIEDGPSVSWKQTHGHMQASYPSDRAGMVARLRQKGYDVSALEGVNDV